MERGRLAGTAGSPPRANLGCSPPCAPSPPCCFLRFLPFPSPKPSGSAICARGQSMRASLVSMWCWNACMAPGSLMQQMCRHPDLYLGAVPGSNSVSTLISIWEQLLRGIMSGMQEGANEPW